MPLEADRKKAVEQILLARDKAGDPIEVVRFLKAWFESLKAWEAQETFERAFSENRMCVRMAPPDMKRGASQSKATHNAEGPTGKNVMIRYHLGSVADHQNPENFGAGEADLANFAAGATASRKNELGLHDVSAVLMSAGKTITEQLFNKENRQPLFIPIPHEEDLQLLYQIEQVAKADRSGPIHDFYVWARARITRIKYGDEADMTTGFLETTDADGGSHYRYGDATEGGKTVDSALLNQRRRNALEYRSKVLTGKPVDNNEVTLKIRQHAGIFPLAGAPGPLGPPALDFKLPKGYFYLARLDGKPGGIVNEAGKLVPVHTFLG